MLKDWLVDAIRELLALFVDDVPFTIAILVWLVIATIGIPFIDLAVAWRAPLLFFGFAAILVASAGITARRRGR